MLDDKAEEYIHFAVDGAARMRLLIDDLLEFSRIERIGRPVEEVAMGTVMEQVTRDLKMSINESGAVITHDPLPVVQADRVQMTQLLQNFVDNAIKYRREEAPKVHVSAVRGPDEWVFSIQDNGIGIPEEQQEQIFLMFNRQNAVEEHPGTGMGLAIAKKIVERHGGRIWVMSTVDKGSTFFFSLPIGMDDCRSQALRGEYVARAGISDGIIGEVETWPNPVMSDIERGRKGRQYEEKLVQGLRFEHRNH